MRKTQRNHALPGGDDLLPEYRFDYAKKRPNRFAGRALKGRMVVILDPDASEVFRSGAAVNNVLRALISAMPQEPDKARHRPF